MYELMILGALSRLPMHGYMIAKVIGDIIGPFRQVQWGSLYPVLSRLAAEGLIEEEACPDLYEGRPRKVYHITDAGRERLRELLLDTEHHLGEYSMIFGHKVSLFNRLTPEERLMLCRHYYVHAQQHIDHIERERRDLVNKGELLRPEEIECIVAVMDHRLDHWRAELVWAEQLIAAHTIQEAV